MDQKRGLSGCQAVGVALAILLVITACTVAGLVVGGGIGLVTGGVAGYTIGRARSIHVQPPIEVPPPQPPEGEERRPPGRAPEIEMRPYLGVRYETTEEGARVVFVEPRSPADRAGLREGDVILAVDGALVGEGNPSLAERILEHEPWEKVELRVRRDGEELELEVTLGARLELEGQPLFPYGERPWPPEWPWERPYLGIQARQLERGAEVLEVIPGQPAEEAGLRQGDIILAVDDEEVTQETPLVLLIAAHEPGDTVTLTIERDGRRLEIEVELGEWPGPEDSGPAWEG